MNKVYLYLLFVILFLTGLQFNSALAQNKIKITLHQPPPNQLSASNLWKMTLENLTDSTLTIYLEGSATKDNIKVVDGTSAAIILPPGRSNYNYKNFETGVVNWSDQELKNFILRTGTVPTGIYITCMQALSSENNIPLSTQTCINIPIVRDPTLTINLIAPSDGESITSDNLIFSWAGVALTAGQSYKLRIVEITGNQSPKAAMQNNRIFFEKDNLMTTSFQYSDAYPKFEKGKKYAWGIKIGDVGSEIYSFTVLKDKIIVLTDTTKIPPKEEVTTRIYLLAPDEEESMHDQRPDFEWLPEMSLPGVTYELKVVEIREEQSPEDALKLNQAFIKESNIQETSLKYPSSYQALDTSKIYAWEVKAVDSKQKIIAQSSYGLISLSMFPPSTGCNLNTGAIKKICIGSPFTVSGAFSGCPYISSTFNYTLSCTNPNFVQTGTASCLSFVIPVPANIFPNCGKYTLKLTGTRSGCSSTRYIDVFVYPNINNLQYTDMPGSIKNEICRGDEGKLSVPNLCQGFDVTWEFRDKPSGGTPTAWSLWGMGNPKNTNPINPVCGTGIGFVDREYQATLSNPPIGWPPWPPTCPQKKSLSIKVWCPPQAGNLTASAIQICVDPALGPYPAIQLGISGTMAPTYVYSWTSGNGTFSNPNIQNPTITFTSPGTHTVTCNITNGPPGTCPVLTLQIQIKVENPLKVIIAADKTDVCPCDYATLDITSITPALPPNSITQWQYSDCVGGSWMNAGTGPSQNTNGICSNNPLYPGITDRLCWRLQVTTPNQICPPNYSNEWQFNIIQKPVINPITPALITKCFGSSITIPGPIPPISGTGPFDCQWYLDGIPFSTDCALTTTEPGNYYVVVYNKDHCDSTRSNVVTIKDCKIKIAVTGDCCSDGHTPITLTANASSTCGTSISSSSYQWSGPCILGTQTGQTLTLNSPPTTTCPITLTVTDANGCVATTTVIITACP